MEGSRPSSRIPLGLAWDGEYLWVSDAYSGQIYRYDFDNQVVVDHCSGLDLRLRDLTWQAVDGGGGYLWAGTRSQPGRVNKIDIETCQIVGGYDIPEMGPNTCHGAAWNYFNDGSEWRYELILGEEGGDIYWIDPSTGAVDRSCTPHNPSGDPRGLAWDGFGIWAGYQEDGQVRQYDETCSEIGICASATLFQQGTTWDGHFLYTTGTGHDMTIARVDVGYPLTVNVVQQGITVAAGSQATFQVEVMNHTADPISMDAWLDAYLRNGNSFGGNPLLSYSLTFPGNLKSTRTVVVTVPAVTPPGNYLIAANVSADYGYPVPTHLDRLRVTVTPPLEGVSASDGAKDAGGLPFTLALQ